jgi:hypothetical protein
MAGRPKKSEKEKLVSVGLSISPKHDAELKQIAGKEHREKGFITRAFYLRGLAAYKADGLLFDEAQSQSNSRVVRAHVRISEESRVADSSRKKDRK